MPAHTKPPALVAAVAQAHGLNANLVRKWLVGRSLKRCGLQNPPTANHTSDVWQYRSGEPNAQHLRYSYMTPIEGLIARAALFVTRMEGLEF